ncbi:MAG: tripartite tricarboxylate transporter TctB family protein [Anaerolineae bacterium]|mgnify:CR=1 FL=1
MKTQRGAQFVVGLVLGLLGLLMAAFSWQIKGMGGTGLQSRTFPLILSSSLFLISLGMLIAARRAKGPEEPVLWPDREGWKRVGVSLASLVAFLLLFEPLGLPLSSVLFVSFSVWYLGRYRPLASLASGLGSGFLMWLVFHRLLELPFPLGILPY